MLKIFILILVLIFSGCESVSVTKGGNSKKIPLVFKKGKVDCPMCKMPLKTKIHSAQEVSENGVTTFFDDPGCMALWLKGKDKQKIVLWIYSDDTKKYIDAKKAWYKLGDHTPMHYGFGAYEKKGDGMVDFEKFLTMMYRGENLTNPRLRKKYLYY